MTDAKAFSSEGIYESIETNGVVEYFVRAFDSTRSRTLVVNSVNALQTLSVKNTILIRLGYYNKVETKGYYSPGDGGGMNFNIEFDNIGPDDGFLIVRPGIDIGVQFNPNLRGKINVLSVGAKGKGNSDDAPFIQQAINAAIAKNIGTVKVPKSTFRLDSTVSLRLGINFECESMRSTVFLKNHSGTGFELVTPGATPYVETALQNISIKPAAGFENEGKGLFVKNAARVHFYGFKSESLNEGLGLEDVMVSTFINVTSDRNIVAIKGSKNFNGNTFTNTKILGYGTGTKGIVLDSAGATVLSMNQFDGGQIEYTEVPVETYGVVDGLVFNSMYFESNITGCKLFSGNNITYNNCFSANAPLIDEASFGARNLFVNSMTDLYPSGIGNVPFSGKNTGPNFAYRADKVLDDNDYSIAPNQWVNKTSLFRHGGPLLNATGPGVKNHVNSQNLSQTTQWIPASSGPAIMENVGVGVGGHNTYTFPAGSTVAHAWNVGYSLANKSFTFQVLLKGKGVLQMRIVDNANPIKAKNFNISTEEWTLIPFTVKFSSNVVSFSPGIYLSNIGSSPLELMVPMFVDKSHPVPPMLRTASLDLSAYESITVANLRTIIVKGTAAPLSGAWRLGDRVENTEPGLGKPIGFICTGDGTPGFWRPYGIIGEFAGPTSARPGSSILGYPYFDTTANKWYYWNGGAWTLVTPNAGQGIYGLVKQATNLSSQSPSAVSKTSANVGAAYSQAEVQKLVTDVSSLTTQLNALIAYTFELTTKMKDAGQLLS